MCVREIYSPKLWYAKHTREFTHGRSFFSRESVRSVGFSALIEKIRKKLAHAKRYQHDAAVNTLSIAKAAWCAHRATKRKSKRARGLASHSPRQRRHQRDTNARAKCTIILHPIHSPVSPVSQNGGPSLLPFRHPIFPNLRRATQPTDKKRAC